MDRSGRSYLDKNVQKAVLIGGGALVELLDVARQHPLVVLLLHRRHLDTQDALGLGRQRFFYVSLDAADKVTLHVFVQLGAH